MDKTEKMAELRREAAAIHAMICCPDTNLVWGEGNLNAGLAIVGEAPGRAESEQGRPFVGIAGRFLNAELAQAGMNRPSTYITGAVKCRPVRPGKNANRRPRTDEVNAWRDIVRREIEIVSPRIILCLGNVAASVIIHNSFRMDSERGVWFEGPFGTRAMATYHPAYVIRWKGVVGSRHLWEFRSDLAAVASALAATTP